MIVTLKNLAQASKQQVFDQVVTHLRAQKVQAKDESNGCVYRAGELKCAAGCLIADDEYKPEMDNSGLDSDGEQCGSNWSNLVRRKVVPHTIHDSLIQELQHIHDSYRGPASWESEFASAAKFHNLQFTPI